MHTVILPEIQVRIRGDVEILCLLRCAHRQLEQIAGMVQSDECCPEILRNLCEVLDALSSVVERLAARHLEQCFSASLQTSDPARQRQALADVVNLYALVCRQAPQINGKEVSWQHK